MSKRSASPDTPSKRSKSSLSSSSSSDEDPECVVCGFQRFDLPDCEACEEPVCQNHEAKAGCEMDDTVICSNCAEDPTVMTSIGYCDDPEHDSCLHSPYMTKVLEKIEELKSAFREKFIDKELTCPDGKHAGKKVLRVLLEDVSYLEWVQKQTDETITEFFSRKIPEGVEERALKWLSDWNQIRRCMSDYFEYSNQLYDFFEYDLSEYSGIAEFSAQETDWSKVAEKISAMDDTETNDYLLSCPDVLKLMLIKE